MVLLIVYDAAGSLHAICGSHTPPPIFVDQSASEVLFVARIEDEVHADDDVAHLTASGMRLGVSTMRRAEAGRHFGHGLSSWVGQEAGILHHLNAAMHRALRVL
jgi:hypothetical protein